jgi:hypothetical protein
MTAKASTIARKEARVRASRNGSEHHLNTKKLPKHEKRRRRNSFELAPLNDLASKVVAAHNNALSVREAALEVSSDLQYVPDGTKADPDLQYRMKLLGAFHILQSLLVTCRHIEMFVAPRLEREVRSLAPNAFKDKEVFQEEYVPLTPSEHARVGLQRLKRLRSRK